MEFIKRHLKNGNEHSRRYMEDELGLSIKNGDTYFKDGELDVDQEVVQHAIKRWVDSAILTPNASQRPILASDPHFAIIYHLKQFTYSFHKTIVERVINEAKHGNYSPIMLLPVAYVPAMIAAEVAKSLLIPLDDEPVWMKSLTGVVTHGIDKAGIMGIPGMWTGYGKTALEGHFVTAIGGAVGPSIGQAASIIATPFEEDRTFFKETVNALPGAVLWNRYTK